MTGEQRAALLALAERCEAATGPDRELDRLLIPPELHGTPAPYWSVNDCGDAVPANFTASIDAALTLVPEGWERIQQEQVRMSDGSIRCWASVDSWPASPKRCATPALAICAAALRARAAQ